MLLAILTISASAIAFTACSDDNDDYYNDTGENDSGNNTEIKGDYTATTDVKTITLKSVNSLYVETYEDYREKNCVYIYEDSNYKYILALSDGKIMLIPFKRLSQSWLPLHGVGSSGFCHKNVYIEDVGYVSSIDDVTKVGMRPWGYSAVQPKDGYASCSATCGAYYPAVQPKHGYAACFQTDNGIQNLRMYISNYKLDNEGAFESITVQYQLY